MSWLPTYYKSHFEVTLEQVGLFSAIPMVVYMVTLFASGLAADVMYKREICSKITIRRLFQSTAFVFITTALFVLSFAPLTLSQTIVMIVIGSASVGFSTGMYQSPSFL